MNSLSGTWLPVGAWVAGEVLPVRELRVARLVFGDGSYEILDRDSQVLDSGDVGFDTSVLPHTIDLVGRAGPGGGKTLHAIYSLDGDLLSVCYDLESSVRPASSEPLEEQMLLMITYLRASPRLAS